MRARSRAAIAAVLLLSACHHPIYYHGPRSNHWDGKRFHNPDGEQGTGGAQKKRLLQYIEAALFHPHAAWPAQVPVAPTVPPRRVAGAAMRVTWVGHSTVLVQAAGLNILTDPVWAQRASPVQWAGPKRVRQPGIRFADLPPIDLVLVSHDHYDHMDMTTLNWLWQRDKPLIVTGLGNDARMAGNGIAAVARDWGGIVPVRPGVAVRLVRAHHWSQRSNRDHDRTLWTGFVVTLPGGDLYYAGDTGAGDMRWAQGVDPGRRVRLALLPIGAIHTHGVVTGNHIDPAQAVTAFEQLGAAYALGVHWGTFELTDEPIDLPPRLLAHALAADRIPAGRFRVTQAGEPWAVPALPPGPSPASPRSR